MSPLPRCSKGGRALAPATTHAAYLLRESAKDLPGSAGPPEGREYDSRLPKSPPPSDEDNQGGSDRDRTGGSGDGGGGGYHPFVEGLLQTMPEPGTAWTIEGRAAWLEAAATAFKLIYKGDGKITISAQPEKNTAHDQ